MLGFSDFLLICLRELLKRRSDVRVIVMSATLHADLFTEVRAEKEVLGLCTSPVFGLDFTTHSGFVLVFWWLSSASH